jgi:hypothetical protein
LDTQGDVVDRVRIESRGVLDHRPALAVQFEHGARREDAMVIPADGIGFAHSATSSAEPRLAKRSTTAAANSATQAWPDQPHTASCVQDVYDQYTPALVGT